MKRTFSISLFLLVVFALLVSACGTEATPTAEPTQAVVEPTEAPAEAPAPTEAPAAEPVTIRALIRPDEGGNVAKYAAQFEQETGNKVAVDFVGWAEIHDKTVTTLASGGDLPPKYVPMFMLVQHAEIGKAGTRLPLAQAVDSPMNCAV